MNIMDTRLAEQLRALREGQPHVPRPEPATGRPWNEQARDGGSRSLWLLAGIGLLVLVVAGLLALVYSGRQLSLRLQLASPGASATATPSAAPTVAEEHAAMARLSAALVQRQQAKSAPTAVAGSPAAPVKAQPVVTLLAVQHVPIAPMTSAPATTDPVTPVSTDNTAAAPPGASSAVSPPESEADAMKLAHRASDLIQQGQIAGARVLLERAQAAHDPKIDFALAETYDPNQLRHWKVLGMVGDPARARALYQRAAKGGMAEANTRIAALPTP